MAKFRELAGDVFSLDADEIFVRSSIFAEYIIENLLTTEDVLDSIYAIVVEAVRRKFERRYQAIVSGLMRVSRMIRVFRHDGNRMFALRNMFERLRLDDGVNCEPLFWLQYSILMLEDNDLRAAEGFLRTAYWRAESSPGFQTFQIDTHALRLLLLIELGESVDGRIVRFDEDSRKAGSRTIDDR